MKKALFISAFLFLLPVFVKAATIDVVNSSRNPSCEQADVQTAINSAINGDTVSVPEGRCVWTSRINLNKEIIVKGAGMGKTIITNYGFTIPDGVNNFRITGFEWDCGTLGDDFVIMIGNSNSASGCRNFRIDHNRFSNHPTYGYAMLIRGRSIGVIDNNEFLSYYGGINYSLTYNGTWLEPANFGSDDFLFVENNLFKCIIPGQYSHVIIGAQGSKYVFRHNRVEETPGCVLPASVDAHGYGHATAPNVRLSTRAYEIYNNTFIKAYQHCCRALYLRGGTGLVFDNVFERTNGYWWERNGVKTTIELRDDRIPVCGAGQATTEQAPGTYCPANAKNQWCNNDGNRYCAGKTVSGSILCTQDSDCGTGNVCAQPGEGYPCCNQIGRGVAQSSEPLYLWNNKYEDGSDVLPGVYPECAKYIQKDRDYFLTQKTGYTPYMYPHPLITDCTNHPITCDQAETITCIVGDVDCNSQVNIQDIQTAINIFLGTANQDDPDYQAKKTRADLTEDNLVNVQDIQKIINIVLGIN